MEHVYITKLAKVLPNKPIDNDTMESILGKVDGKNSKARRIVLRNNQIKTRYYALDANGAYTHTNASLATEAVLGLCSESFKPQDIQLLSCGTSSPDQLLPSHAAMVHGLLKNGNLEINSPTGACCSGMNALKYAYMAVKCKQVENAVCSGSERSSSWFNSGIYNEELQHLKEIDATPLLAFNKEFLRWMLSDGAGAMLLENQPNGTTPLRIEWMDAYSYAFELEPCMYAGGDKNSEGHLKPWMEFSPQDWIEQSVFAVKQDVKLLSENILVKGVDSLKKTLEKHKIAPEDITYYLPHISSYYFKEQLYAKMEEEGVHIPWDKWFLNLDKVGNVGSASIYLMLEELVDSGKLKKGDTILLSVPESARFSYAYAYLKVC